MDGPKMSGGLCGETYGDIIHCFATGNITGGTGNAFGGIVGRMDAGSISDSYSKGNVSTRNDYAGGLIGMLANNDYEINNCVSYGKSVSGRNYVGSFIGGFMKTSETYTDGVLDSKTDYNLTLDKCCSENLGISTIGSCFTYQLLNSSSGQSTEKYIKDNEYTAKMSALITTNILIPSDIVIQAGIYGSKPNQIRFDSYFTYDLTPIIQDLRSDKAIDAIQEFLKTVDSKNTELGAIQNRLDAAQNSVQVIGDNLTAAHSSIKDVDIATESSNYVKFQILQQASATLLSTANQTPSLALQLI